jgi:hypothetical protein
MLAGILVKIVLWHRGGSGGLGGVLGSATLEATRSPSQLKPQDYVELIERVIE